MGQILDSRSHTGDSAEVPSRPEQSTVASNCLTCGNAPVVLDLGGNFAARCSHCRVWGDIVASQEEAIIAWNEARRPFDDPREATIRRLKERIAFLEEALLESLDAAKRKT